MFSKISKNQREKIESVAVMTGHSLNHHEIPLVTN